MKLGGGLTRNAPLRFANPGRIEGLCGRRRNRWPDPAQYPHHPSKGLVMHGRLPVGDDARPAAEDFCYEKRKVNLSTVFAGQKVGVSQVGEHIWLVSFMDYDLGYFDDETCRLEPIENPFWRKVLPMCPE